jgi:hypothetical protein
MTKKRNKKYKLKKISVKRNIPQDNNLLTGNSATDKIIEPSLNPLENKHISSIIKIAIEIWKIEKKVNKIKSSHSDLIVWLDYSIQKIQEIFDANNIKIVDYTGQKYIEWMNWVEIVSVEKNSDQGHPIIFDTITPLIVVDWKMHTKSKVIVLSS